MSGFLMVQAGAGFLFRVTDFIDHQEFRLHERFELPVQAIGVDGLGQSLGQVHGGREVNAVTELCGAHAQTDRQVRLADARRPQQNQIAAFV